MENTSYYKSAIKKYNSNHQLLGMQLNKRGRSFSYNDLKKKRVQRSAKSKRKDTQSDRHASQINSHKRMNKNCDSQNISEAGEKPSQKQSKFSSDIKQKVIYDTPTKPWVSRTDRVQSKNQKRHLRRYLQVKERLSFEDGIFDSKQIIKSLICKKKSAKKLLRLSQLRDRLKQSKEKSREKSHSQSRQEQLLIFQKSLLNRQSPKSKEKPRSKKFYQPEEQLQKNLFGKGSDKRKQAVKKSKQNSEIEQNKRQSESSKKENNLLDLLDVPQKDLKKVLKMKSHESKRKQELKRLKKNFPEGFFQF